MKGLVKDNLNHLLGQSVWSSRFKAIVFAVSEPHASTTETLETITNDFHDWSESQPFLILLSLCLSLRVCGCGCVSDPLPPSPPAYPLLWPSLGIVLPLGARSFAAGANVLCRARVGVESGAAASS